jgi:hypothetical protein
MQILPETGRPRMFLYPGNNREPTEAGIGDQDPQYFSAGDGKM